MVKGSRAELGSRSAVGPAGAAFSTNAVLDAAAGGEAVAAGQVELVADLGEQTGRGEDRRCRLALDVGVLAAEPAAGLEQAAAVAATTLISSRPSSPDQSASAGSWSRTSAVTDSQAVNGMYGGLVITAST